MGWMAISEYIIFMVSVPANVPVWLIKHSWNYPLEMSHTRQSACHYRSSLVNDATNVLASLPVALEVAEQSLTSRKTQTPTS